jgi:predicted TIM-barrel fold metal-dependent hydrolase
MNTPLFAITPYDQSVYEREIRDFLPDRLWDVHVHLWKRVHLLPGRGSFRSIDWPFRVADQNPAEHLLETYRLLFPGKLVQPLVFGTPQADLEATNAYVANVARTHGWPALIFSHPRWSAREFERRILEGGFLGAKSYLSLAPEYLPADEIRTFDFFPPSHLDVLNRHGWLMMLHLPRAARLRDSVNLAQLLEIEERYPHLTVIVAHVGRAYCPEDVGDAFERLSTTQRLMFDISANTNDEVFEQALRAIGPRRLLFGSDLPILRMRMRRICEKGRYVNLVPRGLYGDVTGDPHLREVDSPESDRLTFFMYEEIRAFRRAAERVGLSRADVERVFYANAADRLARLGWSDG